MPMGRVNRNLRSVYRAKHPEGIDPKADEMHKHTSYFILPFSEAEFKKRGTRKAGFVVTPKDCAWTRAGVIVSLGRVLE
jgi:hypothetical protein